MNTSWHTGVTSHQVDLQRGNGETVADFLARHAAACRSEGSGATTPDDTVITSWFSGVTPYNVVNTPTNGETSDQFWGRHLPQVRAAASQHQPD